MDYITNFIIAKVADKALSGVFFESKIQILKYAYGENIFIMQEDPLWRCEMCKYSKSYKFLYKNNFI